MDLHPDDVLNPEDESEFAGYVDSGMWELEEWLGQENRRQYLLRLHFHLLDGE